MLHYWKTYTVPISISAIGLLLALILGLAPLIGRSDNSQTGTIALGQIADLNAVIDDAQAAQSGEIDALRQMISAQSALISDLQNRNANLDRAVTRTFQRSRENADFIALLAGTNQRLGNLEAQMDTLNAAVPRVSQRTRTNADGLAELAGSGQRLGNLEAQMDTLNAAVPRMSARIRELQTAEN
jgi:chromosome segregation ATPase